MKKESEDRSDALFRGKERKRESEGRSDALFGGKEAKKGIRWEK